MIYLQDLVGVLPVDPGGALVVWYSAPPMLNKKVYT